jgi:hypothetical protein
MSVNRLFVLTCILAMSLFSSCTKTAEGITGPAGPAGDNGKSITDQRSAIVGYVSLVNQFTVTDTLADSVHVSTLMGDSVLNVLTDQTGKFILPALKSGTYRIMFKKNGYDSLAVNVDHTAGNEDQFIKIVQVDGTQTTHILSQNMQLLQSPFDMVSKYLDMNTIVSGPLITYATMRYVDVYFSASRNVNSHNYTFMYPTYSHNEGTNQYNTQVNFGPSGINGTPLNAGDTVFMKSYVVPPYSLNTSWFDTNTYQTVSYPYVGDSLSNYFIWTN